MEDIKAKYEFLHKKIDAWDWNIVQHPWLMCPYEKSRFTRKNEHQTIKQLLCAQLKEFIHKQTKFSSSPSSTKSATICSKQADVDLNCSNHGKQPSLGDVVKTTEGESVSSMPSAALRARTISKEMTLFNTRLPLEWDSSIFLRMDEQRMGPLIIGPKDTPYENGVFLFDILLGATYPEAPPKVHFFDDWGWFGTPLEIISDRGPGFRGDLVGELMEQLGISRRRSSPYYPQCNGLVKKVNEVQLASLRVLASGRETPKEQLQQRILDLERLELDRTSAIEFYATQAERRRQKFNEDLKDKELKRGMLVLCYDNRFDNKKDKKFLSRWEGPFLIRKKYSNGSYQLQEINGRLHKTRVNGWKLKPYFQRFDSELWLELPPETEEDEEKGSFSIPCYEDPKERLEA
ncbi:hypothetical protein L7F22_041440 [Adiantum nelumboides]|nr:hypothetical protein [Adiantum nelumboides]